MHKNTFKKPKSQYTLTLSHPQDKKTLFFFLCGCCQVFRNYSTQLTLLHLITYIQIHMLSRLLRFLLQMEFYQLMLTWAWQYKPHDPHQQLSWGLSFFTLSPSLSLLILSCESNKYWVVNQIVYYIFLMGRLFLMSKFIL